MKLTEKSSEVFNYVKSNGGKVSLPDLAEALDRTGRSVSASMNDLAKKGLIVREHEEIEGVEKPVAFAVITAEGKDFVPTEE